MDFKYYDFQLNAIKKATESIFSNKNILISSPTGTGKTLIELGILLKLNEIGITTYIVSKKNEILWNHEDLASELFKVTSISNLLWTPIMLSNSIKNNRIKLPKVIIIDECHHLYAPTWQVFKDTCLLIGLTASPLRPDNEEYLAWKNIFNDFYSCISIVECINRNILVNFYIPIKHLNTIKRNENSLCSTKFISKYIKNNIENIFIDISRIDDKDKRPTLICIPNNHIGHFMTSYFNERGLYSIFVDGNVTKNERIKALTLLKEGKAIIFTLDILIEGIDIPELSRIINLRFMNTIQYVQMIGRGLRIIRKNKYNYIKNNCEIIDFTDTPIVYHDNLKKYLGISLISNNINDIKVLTPDLTLIERVVNNYQSLNFIKIDNYKTSKIYFNNNEYNIDLGIIEIENNKKRWLLKIKENNYVKYFYLDKVKNKNNIYKYVFKIIPLSTISAYNVNYNIDFKIITDSLSNLNKILLSKLKEYNLNVISILNLFSIAFIISLNKYALLNNIKLSILYFNKTKLFIYDDLVLLFDLIPHPKNVMKVHFKK